MYRNSSPTPTILFVDNDWDQIKLIKETAKHLDGVFVTIQKGGESALEYLTQNDNDVDAIVLDLAMPFMSGLELTRLLRIKQFKEEVYPPFEIFWATGYTIDLSNDYNPVTQDYYAYGVRKMFTKPYDVADIVAEIKTVFETRKSNDF